MDRAYRVLVVDDEQDICEILKYNLEAEGYEVSAANSAEEAFRLNPSSYDLLLLDIMMEGISGLEMAKRLKSDTATAQIPIIFLTAKDTENDIVTGFNLGADDYISKPFSIREVVARVRAVIRRTDSPTPSQAANILRYKGLVLDTDRKTVTVNGEEVQFTKTEFELLELMLREKGHVFSRAELISRVWPKNVMVLNRIVDVNITRLRKKVGPFAKCIATRLGFGYYFDA